MRHALEQDLQQILGHKVWVLASVDDKTLPFGKQRCGPGLALASTSGFAAESESEELLMSAYC